MTIYGSGDRDINPLDEVTPLYNVHAQGVELLAAAARLVTGNSQADPQVIPDCSAVVGQLTLTTGATGAGGDLLNVYVQTQIGATWVDVIHFTQIVGTDANDQYYAKIDAHVATAEFEIGAALGAAAVRNFLGTNWATRWVIFDGGGTHSWVYGVNILPLNP